MQTFYRNYDAALGRWTGVDPKADATESMSIYHYAGNNPVMMNDPLGDKSAVSGSGSLGDGIDYLLSHNGGHIHMDSSDQATVDSYDSGGEAFYYGGLEMTANGSWGGGGGFAANYQVAAGQMNMWADAGMNNAVHVNANANPFTNNMLPQVNITDLEGGNYPSW